MSEGPHHPKCDFGPLFLGFFGILCGALIVAAFHYIGMGWRSRRRARQPRMANQARPIQEVSTPNTVDSFSTNLLKVYVYKKDWKQGTCAVCLSEFVEGEEVRILPDCAHAFHVPCVDMWLYSHPNCPLCRTCTTPRATHLVLSLPISSESFSVVETTSASRELPTPLENFPRSAGLPSPVQNPSSDG